MTERVIAVFQSPPGGWKVDANLELAQQRMLSEPPSLTAEEEKLQRRGFDSAFKE